MTYISYKPKIALWILTQHKTLAQKDINFFSSDLQKWIAKKKKMIKAVLFNQEHFKNAIMFSQNVKRLEMARLTFWKKSFDSEEWGWPGFHLTTQWVRVLC